MRLLAILIFALGCPETDPVVQPRIPVTDAPCEAPIELDVTNGRARTRVRLGAPDVEGPCGDGAAVYFSLEIPLPANVSISASSNDPVRAGLFASGCPAADLIAGCPAGLDLDVDAGSYLIGVFGPTDAEIDVTVEIDAPSIPPVRGTCAHPIETDLTADVTISGDFDEALDEQMASCSSEGSPEAVYRIEPTEPADLEVSPLEGYPTVFLRSECAEEAELACGTNDRIVLPSLGSGEYFLIVEAYSEEDYALSLKLDPPTARPPNDRCENAMEVPMFEGGSIIAGNFLAA